MCVCSLNLKQLNSMLSANGVGTPMDCRRIVHFIDRFIGLSFKTLGLGIVGKPYHVKPAHCSMLLAWSGPFLTFWQYDQNVRNSV